MEVNGKKNIHNENIVCIGAHKTGTTSLKVASRILGFQCCPEHLWYRDNEYIERFMSGDSSRAVELLDDKFYNFYEDSPFNFNDFYSEIYGRFPHTLFILTVRDSESWADSFIRWGEKKRLVSDRIKFGYGVNYPNDENREQLIVNYDTRNNEILEFFSRKGNLLVLDLEKEENPWIPLCLYLRVENIPNVKFPHENKTK